MSANQSLNDLKCKVDVLNSMFNCPVCLERLSAPVPQCTKGHHICQKCRTEATQCSFCKSKFRGARNYFMESMITEFEEMKSLLENLSVYIGKKQGNEQLTVIDGGEFPCGVSYCDQSLTFDEMVQHVETCHRDYLTQVAPLSSNQFYHSGYLKHSSGILYDLIYNIRNMGIFILKIDVSNRGKVYGYVETINSTSNTEYFKYTLKIGEEDGDDVKEFSGQVVSTRDYHKKKDYASVENSLLHTTNDGKHECAFYYRITITYVP